ncbi:hypothetical protein PPTG_01867 [Phytophthora nicotianae INRA-310]|uniref:Uncharacterized protein n=1 Tax=Phytophthora nicotianae (strain INRA-310) TaxID=761204 RepID=W2RAP6_PHYN3|nr:hypothetical protein PPTG_01867 [Phytophthora nicotianae INRA-310]ETN21764.1 hypothetical protein PPTG_01867 [Phytophthora nicotianae INRA-310]
MAFENPPTSASELTSLPAMGWIRFAKDLFDGRIEQICIPSEIERMESEAEELRELHAANTTESKEDTLSAKTKKQCFDERELGLTEVESLLRFSAGAQGRAPGSDSCGTSAGQGNTARD